MKIFVVDIKFILALTLVLMGFIVVAQDKPSPKIYNLETRDGNSYEGTVVERDSTRLIFDAGRLGKISLLQSDIRKMTLLDPARMKRGRYWFENPQSTRYFFSPNGYGLKKGEGYYQNIWVLMNSFAVGLNDYVSLGGGTIPLFLFGGTPTPVWVTAKISLPVAKNKFNVAAGVLAATAVGGGVDNGSIGILYGIATAGPRDRNISLGIGYGFAGGSISSTPVINLNGMYRVGQRSYLLTENYYFSDGSSGALLLMYGARQLIGGVGLDYGLMTPVGNGTDSFVAAPWLGITIPFGGRR